MKGITHFAAGLAAASLVPGAVEMAQDGSLIILWGGVAGILPDTIDFKWSKFMDTYHYEIDPDPHEPDPQAIANEVAAAIDEAYEKGGAPVGLMIHTTRMGADAWREVVLTLDHENQEVRSKIGPVVTTGQLPIGDRNPFPKVATAKPKHPIHPSYLETTRVNIFSGPTWELRREGDAVELNFIPWHRRGTHSIFFALCMFLIGWLVLGDLRIGMAMGAGAAAHLLEDQLGFMGCSYLWPFDHRRFKGLELSHSGDPFANFSSIWICGAIVAWQLNRYHSDPPVTMGVLAFVGWFVLLPLGLLYVSKRVFFPSRSFTRYLLPRTGWDGTGEDLSEKEMLAQNIREQDVINELGGMEGTP